MKGLKIFCCMCLGILGFVFFILNLNMYVFVFGGGGVGECFLIWMWVEIFWLMGLMESVVLFVFGGGDVGDCLFLELVECVDLEFMWWCVCFGWLDLFLEKDDVLFLLFGCLILLRYLILSLILFFVGVNFKLLFIRLMMICKIWCWFF